jgi:polyhydroxyalkanoate synthase
MAKTEISPKPRKRPVAKSAATPSSTKSPGAAKTKAKPDPKVPPPGGPGIDSRGKAAESATRPEARNPPPVSSALPDFDAFLSPAQREMLETLSANLARAAVTAQGAIAEAALRQADRPAALSADPFHVGPAFNEVMTSLAAQPDRLLRAQADLFSRYMDLWQSAARKMTGEPAQPVVAPASGDKRFSDPDWASNPMFDMMKQSYLLSSNWLNDLVSQAQGVDPGVKRRVEFFTKMLTDAFSPSNFLISNPAALREVMQSKGESLVRGMENFAADLERGGGQLAISQTDLAKFKVGENVATAPGKVVYQNDILQ